MDDHYTLLKRAHSAAPCRAGVSPGRGFTIIEMAVVLAMSAILLMAFYSFVSTQTMSAFEESSEISVQTDIRQTMSALVQELEGARLSCLDSNANWVCYQMPRTGTSGAMILDANGAVQYGANAFDNSGWQANGYYQIVFVDDANTAPVVESALANSSNPSGQNISGSYAFGSTNFTANYAKAY